MNEFKIETGTITISDTIDNGVEQTITFKFHYVDPIIVAYIATRNNGESIDVRVHDVTSNSCKIFTQEPSLGSHGTEDINYIIVEGGEWTLPSGKKIKAGKTSTQRQHYSGNSFLGDKITFSDAFSVAPVVIHQISSQNSPNFCSSAILSITSTGFEITQEKGGTATDFSVETINWIAFENTGGNFVYDYGQTVKMEVDVENNGFSDGVDNTYHEYAFTNTYSSAPIVIAKMNSSNDTDGAWARASATATNTTRTRVYAEEDQVGDSERGHDDEAFGFVVFSQHIAWRDCLSNRYFKCEVGQVEISAVNSYNGVRVYFQNEYINPVIVTFLQSRANSAPQFIYKTIRMIGTPGINLYISGTYLIAEETFINVGYNTFDPTVKMMNGFIVSLRAVTGTLSNTEKVSYIVMEAGEYEVDGMKIKAGITATEHIHTGGSAYSGKNITFNNAFNSTPILLHSSITRASAVWNVSTTGFTVATETAQTGYTTGQEVVHWIAIDDGNGAINLNGNIGETKRLTAPGNVGVTDTALVHTYANSYNSIPITIVSQNTVNGLDGAWARASSTNTTTQIGVYAEEDTIGDSEQSHTAESFSFLTFASSFAIDLTPEEPEGIDYAIKISPPGTSVTDEKIPFYALSLIDENPSLKEASKTITDADNSFPYSEGMPLAFSYGQYGAYYKALHGTMINYSSQIIDQTSFNRIFHNNTTQ